MYWCSTSLKRYCRILNIWFRRERGTWKNFNCVWSYGLNLLKWIRPGCDRKNVFSWSSWNWKFQTWISIAYEMEGVLEMWWKSFSYSRLLELFIFFPSWRCIGSSWTWISFSLDSWLNLKHPQFFPSSTNCKGNS